MFPNKLQHAIDETSLWVIFALIGGSGASMLSLGLLLRSKQALTYRAVMGTVLHSLAWGVATFLVAYSKYQDDVPFLIGLTMFSGIGVASSLDLLLLLIKQRLGISVSINPPPKEQP